MDTPVTSFLRICREWRYWLKELLSFNWTHLKYKDLERFVSTHSLNLVRIREQSSSHPSLRKMRKRNQKGGGGGGGVKQSSVSGKHGVYSWHSERNLGLITPQQLAINPSWASGIPKNHFFLTTAELYRWQWCLAFKPVGSLCCCTLLCITCMRWWKKMYFQVGAAPFQHNFKMAEKCFLHSQTSLMKLLEALIKRLDDGHTGDRPSTITERSNNDPRKKTEKVTFVEYSFGHPMLTSMAATSPSLDWQTDTHQVHQRVTPITAPQNLNPLRYCNIHYI